MARKRNDHDRYVVPGKAGGWDVVKENHQRASAHFDTKQAALARGRDIVRNAGGGELRIANRQGRFIDSDRSAETVRKVAAPPSRNPIERRMSKFLREPPSIRIAASVIVAATALVVVGGGVLIRLVDHREYPSIWVGMWWAVQTVTTVGYGDVTPKDVAGRVVGALVMLEGTAFIAIITAAITSTFVARAASERALTEAEDAAGEDDRIEARFDDLAERLDRLETILNRIAE